MDWTHAHAVMQSIVLMERLGSAHRMDVGDLWVTCDKFALSLEEEAG